MRKQHHGYYFIAPILLGFMLFYVGPFMQVIWDSLSRGSGTSQAFVWLDNYSELFLNDTFTLAFYNTLRFLGAGLPIIMALSYLLALFLKKQAERFTTLRTIFLLPYVMPVAGTVLLVDLLFSNSGILNDLLQLLGLPIVDWMQSDYAFWIALLLYLWKSTGYTVVLMLAGLLTIHPDQYDVAQVEGASRWQMFIYITTPQMWYALFISLVFSLINAFKCFREIFLVGGDHPHESVYMLQHYLHNTFQNLSYQRLSVAAVLLFLVIAVSMVLMYLWVQKKEEARR